MTPDDWQKAMENEAASVEDTVWARTLRRQIHLQNMLPDLLSASLWFALVALIQVLLVQFRFKTASPSGLWEGILCFTALVSAVMAWQGRSWISVSLGTLVYFPVAWLTVVTLQWIKPGRAVLSPGITEQGIWILLPLAAVVAGLFFVLGRLNERRNVP